MSVYKHENSPYYHFDFQVGGNRFHGSTGTANRREAEAREKLERDKAKAALKASKSAKGGPLTLDVAAGRYWLEVGQMHANSETTETDLGRLVSYFGPTRLLSDISDADVAQLVQWRRSQHAWGRKTTKDDEPMRFVSAATVNRSTTLVLKKIFTRAKRTWRYEFPLEPNWKDHWLAEPKERVRELKSSEASALELATRVDYQPIFDFARATGLRLEECLLRWSEVDWQTGWVTKPGKGGNTVRTAITSTVRDILVPLMGHDPEFVFTYVAARPRKAEASYKGDGSPRARGERYPITYSGLKTQWKRIRKAAKVEDFRFHDFRHDLATKLLRDTGNLKKVQRALSHADIKTTTRYAHVLDEEVADALEALARKQKRVSESRKKSRSGS